MSDVINITCALISRDSLTPDDAGCQEYIAKTLSNPGFYHENLDYDEVKNLLSLHGREGPLFIFLGHTDVVPTGPLESWSSPPFEPEIFEGQLYGRGSADMKGSVAAMVVALQQFVEKYPDHPGRVGLLITSDEEGPAEDGIKKVIPTLEARGDHIDYCLVGEPSCLNTFGDVIRIGRRGSINATLTVKGKQGHTAYPDKADNAIHKALQAVTELSQIAFDNGSDDFPASTIQFSNIHSGTGVTNVIPGEFTARFNIRHGTLSPEPEIHDKVKSILNQHLAEYQLDWKPSGAPFLTDAGVLREAVVETISELLDIETDANTGGGTSDGRFVAPTGSQVVEFGPINSSIHQINEHVGVEELERLVDCYVRIMEKVML